MKLIERLRELDARATPGEWEVYLGTIIFNKHNRVVTSATNAALIAEMRNALPKLLAVVDAADILMNKYSDHDDPERNLVDALAALKTEE